MRFSSSPLACVSRRGSEQKVRHGGLRTHREHRETVLDHHHLDAAGKKAKKHPRVMAAHQAGSLCQHRTRPVREASREVGRAVGRV